MNWEPAQRILHDLTWQDYSVITLNVLLIIFARPLVKRLGASGLADSTVHLRTNLLRALNIFILIAYSYQVVYRPIEEQGIAIKALSILGVIYCAYLLNYLSQYFINKHYGRAREIGDQTLYIQTYQSRLFSIIAAIVLTIIAIISIVRILGFESMLEAGGVLGIFGVLLALTQASWAPDIISGLIILNSDMFEEGDIVEFDGIFGRVYRTKLFHTEVINLRNNHRIMLRNANVRDRTIHNLSKFATGVGLRECLTFNIGYDVPGDAVKTMLNDAYNNALESGIALEPNSSPLVKVLETGDHAVTWGLLFHVKKVDQLINIRRDLRELILAYSRECDISLATPLTHDVSMRPPAIEAHS